jgi:hypothetical protein
VAGVVLVAGLGLTAPASAEPELVLPEGADRPTPEAAPAPPPESARIRAALSDALAAPEAAGTLTVTPSTALVHEQVVTVHGSGWEPRAVLVALQCGPAPGSSGDCEWGLEEFRAGPGGSYTTTTTVDVVIDDPTGPIDCRLVTCRLGVLDISSLQVGIRFADLTFDPAGPDPAHPALTVTPDTGLVDGDRLQVTGTGISVIADDLPFGQLTFCRTPVAEVGDCDRHQLDLVELEGGSLDTTAWAPAILELPSGPYDCRAGSCAVVVIPYDLGPDEWGELSEAAIGEVAFDPAGDLRPPPTVTGDPDTGLVDGDTVEVEGSGFDPERGYLVQQCRATATNRRDCVASALMFGETDEDGDLHLVFGVTARFRSYRGFLVDCRVEDCAIVVGHGNFGRHGRVPLAFDPDGPLLDPSITVEPSTGLRDGDEVRVTGRNWPAGQPVVLAQCPAGEREPFFCEVDFAGLVWPGVDDPSVLVPVARTRAEAAAGTGFETTFRVSARVEGNDGEVDCRRSPCELLAGDFDGLRLARAPLAFGEADGPISASPSFTG